MKPEIRKYVTSDITTTGNKIAGYAAKFGVASQDLGGFIEIIAPGAFDLVLSEKQDVRGLFNHDADAILARVKSGTLSLSVDETGFRYEFEAPDTTAARDLIASLKRGDIDGSSFSFVVAEGGDSWAYVSDQIVRTITKIQRCYDVGPVTFPAYLDATAGLEMDCARRSLDAWKAKQAPPGMSPSVARARIAIQSAN